MNMMKFHKKNLSLSVEILHSARIMHYYNSNILERIKIKKKEAVIKTTTCKDPKIYAQAVLDPFASQIKNSKLEVIVQSVRFQGKI